MKVLFVHQNFPGQFKFLAPALVRRGHDVVALTLKNVDVKSWQGVSIVSYAVERGTTLKLAPWLTDVEAKIIRGEACFKAALALKQAGFYPDVIMAHPGWGESLFLKDVWPRARLAIYAEFYYQQQGADIGFDPEFSDVHLAKPSWVKLKNINMMLHMEMAEAALSPTVWQASTFPDNFKPKISVIHDGIDTRIAAPNSLAELVVDRTLTLKKNDENEVITFVNRNLEPYRGFHIFMRALPEILKRRQKAHVLIVGGDKVSYGAAPKNGQTWKAIFTQEVRDKIHADDWRRVHFLGRISYSQFIGLLQVSHVHAYLTYPFVLSWSLMEAMSAGCAVVASRTSPLLEVIEPGKNGRLVDFFDVQAWVDNICDLLDCKDESRKLGEHARQVILHRYDLNTVCLPKQIGFIEGL